MPVEAAVEILADGVRRGDRASIGRAVTLVESGRPDHRVQAQQLLVELRPRTGQSFRVGVTGVPGVGKSTFIDQLGTNLTTAGHRVAVLAVDPSSSLSGGSILGDKTRMARLAVDPDAFVRPSPTRGTLGGVTRATRETMLVMEAAGYDVVLVETVGVGQSEYLVADMVDTFLLLTLARTGDQLQGMKRGILELADVIAVNKADGSHEAESEQAAAELSGALRILRSDREAWHPPVITCSALHNSHLDRVWSEVLRHRSWMSEQHEFEVKRRRQLVEWTRSMVRDRLLERLDTLAVRDVVATAEERVLDGRLMPEEAASRIVAAANQPTQVDNGSTSG